MSNEIGSLRALSDGGSQFVGSSSGVFFINTVRRAFSTAATTATTKDLINESPARTPLNETSPEDYIDGPEAYSYGADEPGGDPALTEMEYYSSCCKASIEDMSKLPSHDVARKLVMTYFRTWHPLLPFLHGPSFLDELDALYVGGHGEQSKPPRSLSQAIIFYCIFRIASLDRPDLPPLVSPTVRSAAQLLPALAFVALRSDLISIQALLSAQLYFVANMSLRTATSIGGLISRSITKTGLHRCPFRYSHLSASDRDIRKRAFWSTYALDRFLSQSLGHTLGIQDSDVDVCPPGERELHQPVTPLKQFHVRSPEEETMLHLPANHPRKRDSHSHPPGHSDFEKGSEEEGELSDSGSESATDVDANEAETMSPRKLELQSVLVHYVTCSQLTGRALELFHKSIHVRAPDNTAVLFLRADIEAWGNDLPRSWLIGSTNTESRNHMSNERDVSATFRPDVFFSVAHQQLTLFVNRPSLSLEPSSAEFSSGIQICIRASKSIIRTLERHSTLGYTIFWPGAMSAVWMSGLVVAFAWQLKLHNTAKAVREISAALSILKTMTERWRIAKHCRRVLSELLENMQGAAGTHGRASRNEESTAIGRQPDRNVRANVLESDTAAPEGPGTQRASKRRRHNGSSDWHSSAGHFPDPSRRNYTGSDVPQPQNVSRTFSTPGIGVDYSKNIDLYDRQGYSTTMKSMGPPEQPYGGRSRGVPIEARSLSTEPTSSGDRYSVQPSYGTSVLTQPISANATNHRFEQSRVPAMTSFANPHGGEWPSYQDMTVNETSDTFFDAFDGATWGSLLELMDGVHGYT